MSGAWLVVWVLSGAPDVLNSTGSDHAWLMWLIAAFAIDVNSSRWF